MPTILPSSDTPLDIATSHYSMSSFSVPTREHHSPQQSNQQYTGQSVQSSGILASQNWGGRYATSSDASSLHKSTFDTEMSSDQACSDRQASLSNSNHPTPATSHHGSSNTSYSPPSVESGDVDAQRHGSESTAPSHSYGFQPSAAFSGFTPPPDQFSEPSRVMAESDQYTLPLNWDMGSAGVPAPGTGMSPLNEAGWTQMYEMGWDGSMESGGGWRPGISERR